MKRYFLLILLILNLVTLETSAQITEFNVLFLIDSVSVEQLKNANDLKLSNKDKIRLPHCARIKFLPDYKGFYLINDSILENETHKKAILITIFKGINFSNGGDNIEVKIVESNRPFQIVKSYVKTEKIENQTSKDIFELMFNYQRKDSIYINMNESYYVRNETEIYKITERIKLLEMKKIPYLGTAKGNCE